MKYLKTILTTVIVATMLTTFGTIASQPPLDVLAIVPIPEEEDQEKRCWDIVYVCVPGYPWWCIPVPVPVPCD